jgi:quercetin dioxygenase-like cupin family protein
LTAWVKKFSEDELQSIEIVPLGKWKRYVSLNEDGRGMIAGMGSMAPGEEVSHAHIEEELFFVLKGQGEAIWEEDGQEHRAALVPGAVFYKTSDIKHTMRNTGQEDMVGIFFKV